jgi:hypothetical protein
VRTRVTLGFSLPFSGRGGLPFDFKDNDVITRAAELEPELRLDRLVVAFGATVEAIGSGIELSLAEVGLSATNSAMEGPLLGPFYTKKNRSFEEVDGKH